MAIEPENATKPHGRNCRPALLITHESLGPKRLLKIWGGALELAVNADFGAKMRSIRTRATPDRKIVPSRHARL
jgi:hypothetical protein